MKSTCILIGFVTFFQFAGVDSARAVDDDLPHLRKQGAATQLVVDGQPFVMLAGELHNSSSSSLDYLAPIWPRLTALRLNTVIASISWELVEPEEGRFDFRLVDGIIEAARRHDLRLVFIEEGVFRDGRWIAGRRLNGDEAPYKVNLGGQPRILIGKAYRFP